LKQSKELRLYGSIVLVGRLARWLVGNVGSRFKHEVPISGSDQEGVHRGPG